MFKYWDFSLEGQTCFRCNGTGNGYEQGDAHRSSGIIPCPGGRFQGHGIPVCRKGSLTFTDYDLKTYIKEHPKFVRKIKQAKEILKSRNREVI